MKLRGFASPLLLVAGIGLLVFFALIGLAPSGNNFLTTLNPKPESQAAAVNFPLADTPWPIHGQSYKHNQLSPYKGPHTLNEALSGGGKPKWELTGQFTNIGNTFNGISIGNNDLIYVSSGMAGFYAIDKKSGTFKWAFQANTGVGTAEPHIEFPPTVAANGLLYVTSENGYIYAVDPNSTPDTSKKLPYKWRFGYKPGNDHMQVPVALSPDGSSVHYVTDVSGVFFSLDPLTGIEQWRYVVGGVPYASARRSTIVYDGGGNIYFALNDTVWSLTKTGQLRWKQVVPKPVGSSDCKIKGPSVSSDGSTLYFAYCPQIVAINNLQDTNPAANHILWRTTLVSGSMTDNGDERIPSIDKNGIIYAGTSSGRVYALNPDGSIKWNKILSGSGGSRGGIRSEMLIDNDGMLYFVGDKEASQTIYAINPQKIVTEPDNCNPLDVNNPNTCLLWKYAAKPGGGYPGITHALDSDGTLYMVTGDRTIAAFGGGPLQSPAPSPSLAPQSPGPSFAPSPSPSPSPSKNPSPSPSASPSPQPSASSGGGGGTVNPQAPVITPTVSCINSNTTTPAVNISWTNPSKPVLAVQISTQPDFFPRWDKNVSGTSTTAPDGYTPLSNSGAFQLQPNTTYYVRLYNFSYSPVTSFSIPACAGSSSNPSPFGDPTASPGKPGDLDGDGKVGIFDFNILLSNFGKFTSQGDLDGDGKVGIFDFNILLGNFGK